MNQTVSVGRVIKDYTKEKLLNHSVSQWGVWSITMTFFLSMEIPAIAQIKCPPILNLSETETTAVSDPSNNKATVLFFETSRYAVRIYRQSQHSQFYMNIYDLEKSRPIMTGTPAEVSPKLGRDDNWTTYVNIRGDVKYYARVNPQGGAELQIINAQGKTTYTEVGTNVVTSP